MRGVKAAALELWGPSGLSDIARRIPEDARRAVIDAVVMPSAWVPEEHVIAVCRAVWEGPAAKEDGAFTKYMERVAFHAFGRFQKLLLAMATPSTLATRTPALWRREHTHGTLAVECGERGQIIRLTGGPYLETAFTRGALAETFRQVMDLTRVKITHSRYEMETRETLAIHQSWR
jgi:hypothetical protein